MSEVRSNNTRLQTCGECEFSELRQIGPKGYIPGVYVCAKTVKAGDPTNAHIVPQNSTRDQVEFLRVPEWCPRPDSEVQKRISGERAHPLNRKIICQPPQEQKG